MSTPSTHAESAKTHKEPDHTLCEDSAMTPLMTFAFLLVTSLVFAKGEASSGLGRKMLQDDHQVDAVRLNARSVEQAAALARAGIVVQPEAASIAPAPGYPGVQTPSQAPMPSPAPDAATEGTLIVGTLESAPSPADTIAEAPQHDFDDLGTTIASLPLYPEDGYGL